MTIKSIQISVIKQNQTYIASATNIDYIKDVKAKTWKELQIKILESINLFRNEKDGLLSIDDIEFTYDFRSFFDVYKVINVKALSERMGMNQSLLAQYIQGIKTPSQAQTNRIIRAVRKMARELSEVKLNM